ncbi:uncharacterized protein LOC115680155, partial [Syzygium oleosum]|uniref:uncharacterized protein LOC115680155 n=1 Tax=Syzygium oleosum TaxID=219896 RepID=UPI0024BA7285
PTCSSQWERSVSRPPSPAPTRISAGGKLYKRSESRRSSQIIIINLRDGNGKVLERERGRGIACNAFFFFFFGRALVDSRLSDLASPPSSTMTTSRRFADRKVDRFEKNIKKRGAVPETTTKKGKDYPVGPLLLGFFIFVVIGSSLFQIIRTAASGGMA